jgi:hypothetical protein
MVHSGPVSETLNSKLICSHIREVPPRGVVSMDSRRGNDLFHGLLALGNE